MKYFRYQNDSKPNLSNISIKISLNLHKYSKCATLSYSKLYSHKAEKTPK